MRILYHEKTDDSYHVTEIVDIGYDSDLFGVGEENSEEQPQEGIYAFDTEGNEIVFPNIPKYKCNSYLQNIYRDGILDLSIYDYEYLEDDETDECY